jgi:hypothetical protein
VTSTTTSAATEVAAFACAPNGSAQTIWTPSGASRSSKEVNCAACLAAANTMTVPVVDSSGRPGSRGVNEDIERSFERMFEQ